jgi:predicted GH43/DUF377 family glycosyl hydrolase
MLVRGSTNPILTREDIPDVPPRLTDATSVFNPGAAMHEGRYHLMLRVQTRGRETLFMMADGDDGIHFSVRPEIIELEGFDGIVEPVYHCYDARITKLADVYYAMFAMDTDFGTRLGLARTEDLASFEFVAMSGTDDVRNGVLFPEKVGSSYMRFERPNRRTLEGGVTSGDEIVLSESQDLVNWHPLATVMRGRPHYWDELIGPGPPPLKTRDGWLLVYHGVAMHGGCGIYQAGAALFDLDDPSRLIARSGCNILEPREPYEMIGQVPNCVFPVGLIAESVNQDGFADSSGRAFVYYGAADTCVGLATCLVGDLVKACHR